MNNTQMRSEPKTQTVSPAMVDLKLEVVRIPVSDVERAKRFYEKLGWRLDADIATSPGSRVVQMTPPHSECSIIFGTDATPSAPGSAQGMMLIVSDIEAARADLIGHGIDVSEAFHYETKGRVSGPDPSGDSYRTWASFNDPDGNGWLLQEIRTRLPGRVWSGSTNDGLSADDAALTDLLREAETHHGGYEATAPKHHWSAWYAAYIVAREHGRTPDEASKDAALHMESIRK